MVMLMSEAKRIPTVTGNLTSGATYRGNWCNLLQNVSAGLVSIENALQGQTITIGVVSNSQVNSAAMMTYNTTTGAPNGGFLYTIWMTAAQMQGFSISWVTIPTRTSSQSDTTWLQQYISKVDFMSNVYTDTTQRESLGIGFTPTIVELSHLLVVPQRYVKVMNLWNFAMPFSNELWGLLFATLVLNGFVYWLVQDNSPRSHEDELTTSPAEKPPTFSEIMFMSILSFPADKRLIRAGKQNIKTMLLNMGFSFLCMILAASYLANLASTLVTPTLPVLDLQSIDDANAQGATLCLGKGASTVAIISQYYPNIKQVYFPTPDHIAAAAKGVECKGAVVNAQDWAFAQTKFDQDPACTLIQAGSPIRYYSGGYPYFQDFTTRCSSFLNGLLSPTFLSLAQSGTLQGEFKNVQDTYATESCSAGSAAALAAAADNAAKSVEISNLAGIFILYSIIVGLSLIMHVVDLLMPAKVRAVAHTASTHLSSKMASMGLSRSKRTTDRDSNLGRDDYNSSRGDG